MKTVTIPTQDFERFIKTQEAMCEILQELVARLGEDNIDSSILNKWEKTSRKYDEGNGVRINKKSLQSYFEKI